MAKKMKDTLCVQGDSADELQDKISALQDALEDMKETLCEVCNDEIERNRDIGTDLLDYYNKFKPTKEEMEELLAMIHIA